MEWPTALPDNPLVAMATLLLFVLFAAGGSGWIIQWRKDRRAGKSDDRDLVAKTLEMARTQMRETEADNKELRAELAEERAARKAEMAAERAAREAWEQRMGADLRTLRRHVAEYEGRTMQLEATLRAHGIDVPPWTMLPGDGTPPDLAAAPSEGA